MDTGSWPQSGCVAEGEARVTMDVRTFSLLPCFRLVPGATTMNDASMEDVVRQLNDNDDWLMRAVAVRKLMRFGSDAIQQLPRLFELAFDAKVPIQSDSCRVIRHLGAAAVPFLLERLRDSDARRRARTINLLSETGDRMSTTVRLAEQVLPPRNGELPEWGCEPDVVLDAFRKSLEDPDHHVRFAAASSLEEFGRDIPEVIPVFIETLAVGTAHEQNWAALRLGRIGTPARSACEALRRALDADCRYTHLAVRNALQLIGCVTC